MAKKEVKVTLPNGKVKTVRGATWEEVVSKTLKLQDERPKR